MALKPPDDELVEIINGRNIDKFIKECLYGRSRLLSTFFTTTSSTSTSSTMWGGTGYSYYTPGYYEKSTSPITPGYYEKNTSPIKMKSKEPDYIPSDEPSGKRKLEAEVKFDPSFLDMEGE